MSPETVDVCLNVGVKPRPEQHQPDREHRTTNENIQVPLGHRRWIKDFNCGEILLVVVLEFREAGVIGSCHL
ncbi:hypothetical protein predicted by Glimmer/Critica [Corynebacterium glutamicum ATCC 13032]|nr:hypothetical protein predicted by Glimmer/Critica [Corynebacterium glutamicum ATCC 13032]